MKPKYRLKLTNADFVSQPIMLTPPRAYENQSQIPDYVIPQLDLALEPHIRFGFQRRLKEELTVRDPAQAHPDDLLPEELPPPGKAHAAVQTEAHTALPKLDARAMARIAEDRERRFRSLQSAALGNRMQRLARKPLPRAAIKVVEGGRFDASLIEDRDYDLSEVVGMGSRFRLRLVPWSGGALRPVVADDNSLILVLGGRSRDKTWIDEVVEPATSQCHSAVPRLARTVEGIVNDTPPTLVGGVGATFNEVPIPSGPGQSAILDALVFFQLFSTLAMKRLVGYGNCLLQTFCTAAFDALNAEKQVFLLLYPDAPYPCDTGIFSAATFELGGPHCHTLAGLPDRHQAGTWSILTSLGNFAPLHGGHIILWDLGLVSLDLEFAARASQDEHAAREVRRADAHEEILETFPLEEDLAQGATPHAFSGTWDPSTEMLF
ncbi:hypothetical protein C8R46DRAFT_1238676 [Mycena filopes]|nr:hypothetical protein C8R46DRAFT_1238676 [Mycena filopes]